MKFSNILCGIILLIPFNLSHSPNSPETIDVITTNIFPNIIAESLLEMTLHNENVQRLLNIIVTTRNISVFKNEYSKSIFNLAIIPLYLSSKYNFYIQNRF